MRGNSRAAIAVIAAGSGCVGGAAHAQSFNVPAGRLGNVAAALGAQAGATITVPDPGVAARRSPGVRGAMPLRSALTRALRGADAEAIFYDNSTIRIIARRIPPAAPRQPRSQPEQDRELQPDVIVTASKQQIPLNTYPGSVSLLTLTPEWTSSHAAEGSAAITKLLPALASTNLGPGRNKLFIRGIADSSFTGPTQSTVGQYLGDIRLTYNAPDPHLNLSDMKRVEVLVGPQGTLYGAGSLGGVIRLVPNVPDLNHTSVTMSGGLSATQHGGIGRDGAGTLNVRLIDDKLAFRLVVFGANEAGYIDDPSRGLHNINSTLSFGERFSLRAALSNWTIDVGVTVQNIADQDGQYVLKGNPPLTRTNAIAQPFGNEYRLGYITVKRPVGRAELVSTTSIARHHLTTTFDATGHDGKTAPARFYEDNDITLFAHETRVSGGNTRMPWVGGLSMLFNSSTLSRTIGPRDNEQRITGVVNTQLEGALFGQISHPIFRTLTATLGGRLVFANSSGLLIDKDAKPGQRLSRNAVRFSNTFALDWHPGGRLSYFLHNQRGYRAGGLAVAPAGAGVTGQKFTTDALSMIEAGLRLGDEAHDRLSIRAAMFYADWNHIQADLVDSSGLPYTTNIGRGRLFGLDGQLTWRISPALTFSTAAFVNDSRLFKPNPAFATNQLQPLPNIARAGARFALGWRRRIGNDKVVRADLSVRYVGSSLLGVGSVLDIPQGNYVVADAAARFDLGRFGITLDVDNVANTTANTFAFGNPFGLAQRDQLTPLRPRTIRLGLETHF